MAYDLIAFPAGFSFLDLIGWGTTSFVVLDRASHTVVKKAYGGAKEPRVARERLVYERLTQRGGHPGVLAYHGPVEDDGLRLQYAVHHHLLAFQRTHGVCPERQARWIVELVEAAAFVHDAGVIHGDLTLANVFLDETLHVRLGDFGSASLDGLPLLAADVPASYACPGSRQTVRADIFALGCAMYELLTGAAPFAARPDDEIARLFGAKQFPATSYLGAVGVVIGDCWLGRYADCRAVLQALRALQTLQVPQG